VLLALLHRYSGETDIGIGVCVANRLNADLGGIVGRFAATLPLRGDASGDPTFAQMLDRTNKAIGRVRNLRHSPFVPLKDVSFNFSFHPALPEKAQYEQLTIVALAPLCVGSRYDVDFQIVELAGGWRVACEYNPDLFDAATAAGLIEHFERLLRAVAAGDGRPISRLPLLTDAERHELVVTVNQTQAKYPADRTVADLVSTQARRTPHAVAVVCGDVELTYAELDAASNRLARELTARGLGCGKHIGIWLERSPDLVVALLAVLKARCSGRGTRCHCPG
jgi:non-ribosomal peptide synthetase component F